MGERLLRTGNGYAHHRASRAIVGGAAQESLVHGRQLILAGKVDGGVVVGTSINRVRHTAKDDDQHVEGRGHFQVVENEQAILFGAGQHAFTSTAAPSLAGLLRRKTRIGLLLAAHYE